MDKINHLVKPALLNSQKYHYNEILFGPMKGVIVTECELELEEVFGESNNEYTMSFLFLSELNHF